MKQIFTLVLVFFISLTTFAQKINGQWRGYFDSKGDIVLNGSNNTEYVLELEIDDAIVSGYSYSYFQNRRYYVICKLEGIFYKNSKSIKVTEVARIKGNTPPDFSDCLQIHFLTYNKEAGKEQMAGKWESAPGQRGSCGSGTTTLVRRTLSKDLASFKAANKTALKVEKKPVAVKEPIKKYSAPPVAKKSAPVTKKTTSPSILPVPPVVKAEPSLIEIDKETKPLTPKMDNLTFIQESGFEKRKSEL